MEEMPSFVVAGFRPGENQVWSVKAAWDERLRSGTMVEQHRDGQQLTTWVVHQAPDSKGWAQLWGDAPDGDLDLRVGDQLLVDADLPKDVGVGDVIAQVTRAFGIPPCGGCEERRRWLNEHLPKLYRRRGR